MITFTTILSFLAGVFFTFSFIYFWVGKSIDEKGCFIFTGLSEMYVVTNPQINLQTIVPDVEVEYSKDVLKSIDEYVEELIEKETKDKD